MTAPKTTIRVVFVPEARFPQAIGFALAGVVAALLVSLIVLGFGLSRRALNPT